MFNRLLRSVAQRPKVRTPVTRRLRIGSRSCALGFISPVSNKRTSRHQGWQTLTVRHGSAAGQMLCAISPFPNFRMPRGTPCATDPDHSAGASIGIKAKVKVATLRSIRARYVPLVVRSVECDTRARGQWPAPSGWAAELCNTPPLSGRTAREPNREQDG